MLDKKIPIYLFIYLFVYLFRLISHGTALVRIDLVFENRVKHKCHKWLKNFLSKSFIIWFGKLVSISTV